MKKKSISEKVQERLKSLEKTPAHQQGRMRSALIPGTEQQPEEDEATDHKPERD